MTDRELPTWRQLAATTVLVFLISVVGCGAAFTLWLRDLSQPQVVVLGSGNRLSVLVVDGPARLLLATGDSRVELGNALSRSQPVFARRIDVLLMAGQDETLLAPWAAEELGSARTVFSIAPLLPSPVTKEIGLVPSFAGPRRIRLGPNLTVAVETVTPYGAEPTETFPAWRLTVERGASRVVVLSDGGAAEELPPAPPASVLVVSGEDPTQGWDATPAVALIANGAAVDGQELREELEQSRRQPEHRYRVSGGEALRLIFVDGGIALPPNVAATADAFPADVLP